MGRANDISRRAGIAFSLLLAVFLGIAGAMRADAIEATPASKWSLNGSATIGLGYDSNATFRTHHGTVRIQGVDLATGSDFRPEDDGKLYGSLFSFLNRPLDRLPGAEIESLLFVFGSRQFNLHEVDYRAGEVNLGVRFRPLGESSGFSLKPFLVSAASDSGSDATSFQAGAGLQLAHTLTRRLRLEGGVTWRRRDNRRKGADDFDVRALDGSVRLTYLADGGGQVSALVGARDADSAQTASDFSELRVGVTAGLPFHLPIGDAVRPWRASLSVLFLRSSYGTDASVDPNVSRTDRVWNATLGLTVPLFEHWSLTAEVGYSNAKSTLPNFEFDNLRPQLSVSRFF